MLTDDLWAALEPLVEGAKRHKGGQAPRLPDRSFFEALLYEIGAQSLTRTWALEKQLSIQA
jgi:hypothetical protein